MDGEDEGVEKPWAHVWSGTLVDAALNDFVHGFREAPVLDDISGVKPFVVCLLCPYAIVSRCRLRSKLTLATGAELGAFEATSWPLAGLGDAWMFSLAENFPPIQCVNHGLELFALNATRSVQHFRKEKS